MKARGYARQECNQIKVLQQEREIHISVSELLRSSELYLKTGKARAIRFATLEAICEALSCQPGDILHFEPEQAQRQRPTAASKRRAS